VYALKIFKNGFLQNMKNASEIKLEISLVLPTYREKNSIRKVILDFQEFSQIKEIIVVDNNAEIGTIEQVADLGVLLINEPTQGYGSAIKTGIRSSKYEYVCICEPDGTFNPSDLNKLISYSRESDFIVGTRTNTILVWSGANMGLFLRWGNWFVAKLTELLFNTTYLSDVGCTFRLVKRERALEIIEYSRSNGSIFGFQMLLEALIRGCKVIQIPVNYHSRIGESSVTGSKLKAFMLGNYMMIYLVRRRLQTLCKLK
jgi:glycosyltransferase involved in cell wall biosynthesis